MQIKESEEGKRKVGKGGFAVTTPFFYLMYTKVHIIGWTRTQDTIRA